MQTFDDFIASNFPAATSREKQTFRRVWDAAQAAERTAEPALPVIASHAPPPTVTSVPAPKPPKLSEDGLEKLTKPQLVSHAKLHDLKLDMSMVKDEMIDEILARYLE